MYQFYFIVAKSCVVDRGKFNEILVPKKEDF